MFDISQFWPADGAGKAMTVNAVAMSTDCQRLGVWPRTLKLAKQGKLERVSAGKLLALQTLCSLWAGRYVRLEEIVKGGES